MSNQKFKLAVTEEPAKAEGNLPNLVLKGIWQRSIQGTNLPEIRDSAKKNVQPQIQTLMGLFADQRPNLSRISCNQCQSQP